MRRRLLLLKANPTINQIIAIINAFKSRILTDFGIFEGEDCINSSITSLISIDIYPIGDAAIIAFRTRILADSGTFEAYNCGIVAVQDLANIDL